MRNHWHVLIGLRGLYMPDMNICCGSRREANSCAKIQVDIWNSEESEKEEDQDYMRRMTPGLWYSKHNMIQAVNVGGDCELD